MFLLSLCGDDGSIFPVKLVIRAWINEPGRRKSLCYFLLFFSYTSIVFSLYCLYCLMSSLISYYIFFNNKNTMLIHKNSLYRIYRKHSCESHWHSTSACFIQEWCRILWTNTEPHAAKGACIVFFWYVLYR